MTNESTILKAGTFLIELADDRLSMPSGIDVFNVLCFNEGFVAIYRTRDNDIELTAGNDLGELRVVKFSLKTIIGRQKLHRIVATWNQVGNSIKLCCDGSEVASGNYKYNQSPDGTT